MRFAPPFALFLLSTSFAQLAFAQEVPPGTYCPDGHVLRVPPQPGWVEQTHTNLLGAEFAFAPAGVAQPDRAMLLQGSGSTYGRSEQATDASVRAMLERSTDLRNALGGGVDSEPFAMRHPRHPSAASHELSGGSHLYTVAFDPGGPYFAFYSATLVTKDRAATPEDFAGFKRFLASIEVDVAHVCDFESGVFALRAIERKSPPPAARAPAPASPLHATGEFEFDQAIRACWTLQELFVGAYCNRREVSGRPAVVVHLEGDDPVPQLVDRYARTIATPYCREAKAHPRGALPLVFESDERGALREYDCAGMQLGKAVR